MGNFSRDTFDRLKHYVSVRLQQGVPIVDADWNELQDIRKHELETFLKWFVGNGVPAGDNGFAILDVFGVNDYTIADGRCLVEGWEAVNDWAEQHNGELLRYSTQPLYGNAALAAAWGVDPLPQLTVSAPRTDTVYLDVWEREVGAAEDDAIVNPQIGIETSVRTKREWVVRIAEGMTAPPAPVTGHVHYVLARSERFVESAEYPVVTDLRRTGLTVASVMDLAASKVDRAGDRITGNLQVDGKVTINGSTTPVLDVNASTTGITADAVSDSTTNKIGIQGAAVGAAGWKYGVFGTATGNDTGLKFGVYGAGGGIAGTSYGVYGSATSSETNTGVYGTAIGGSTCYGLRAYVNANDSSTKYGAYSQVGGDGGQKTGLYAAVSGNDGAKYGVVCNAAGDDKDPKYGVFANVGGTNGTKNGVYCDIRGDGDDKYGIRAFVTGIGGLKYGLYSQVTGDDVDFKYGVYTNVVSNGGTKYGVYATVGGTGTNWAGWFNGNLHVNGTLTKGSGTFCIDHVLDPDNKVLRHSFVESPEDLCLYRGKVKLDAAGKASVDMPAYFAALTKEEEATVLLTAIGDKPCALSYVWQKKITRLTIHGEPDMEVSYLVLADRDDPVIRRLRRPVEEDKEAAGFERGKLLYPEAYGHPAPETRPAEPPSPPVAAPIAPLRVAEDEAEEHRKERDAAAEIERQMLDRAGAKAEAKQATQD